MDDLILVGCGQSKKRGSHPASQLYTGNLFRMGRLAAEASGHPWGIISAKHHFIWPTEVIESYDLNLGLLSYGQREAWATAAFAELERKVKSPIHRLRVTILASVFYSEPLAKLLQAADAKVIEPLRGLSLFNRVARMKAMRDAWIRRGIANAVAS